MLLFVHILVILVCGKERDYYSNILKLQALTILYEKPDKQRGINNEKPCHSRWWIRRDEDLK